LYYELGDVIKRRVTARVLLLDREAKIDVTLFSAHAEHNRTDEQCLQDLLSYLGIKIEMYNHVVVQRSDRAVYGPKGVTLLLETAQ
jgi:hypothetical protein